MNPHDNSPLPNYQLNIQGDDIVAFPSSPERATSSNTWMPPELELPSQQLQLQQRQRQQPQQSHQPLQQEQHLQPPLTSPLEMQGNTAASLSRNDPQPPPSPSLPSGDNFRHQLLRMLFPEVETTPTSNLYSLNINAILSTVYPNAHDILTPQAVQVPLFVSPSTTQPRTGVHTGATSTTTTDTSRAIPVTAEPDSVLIQTTGNTLATTTTTTKHGTTTSTLFSSGSRPTHMLSEQERITERNRKGRERSLRTRRRNAVRMQLLEANVLYLTRENGLLRDVSSALGAAVDVERVVNVIRTLLQCRRLRPPAYPPSENHESVTGGTGATTTTMKTTATTTTTTMTGVTPERKADAIRDLKLLSPAARRHEVKRERDLVPGCENDPATLLADWRTGMRCSNDVGATVGSCDGAARLGGMRTNGKGCGVGDGDDGGDDRNVDGANGRGTTTNRLTAKRGCDENRPDNLQEVGWASSLDVSVDADVIGATTNDGDSGVGSQGAREVGKASTMGCGNDDFGISMEELRLLPSLGIEELDSLLKGCTHNES